MLRNCTTYIPRRNNRAVNEVLHEEKRWCGHLGDGKSRRGASKVRRLQLRHELNTQQQTLTPCLCLSVSLPFVLYDLWTSWSSLSLGLGQPWPCLDHFPLLAILFGIAFHLRLVLLSYHPICLRPYHFLKLVSFLGANRTKSTSVCLWLLRGAI